MKVHYRLKRSEVECRELRTLQRGCRAGGPRARASSVLAPPGYRSATP